jgi:hypothetical protein
MIKLIERNVPNLSVTQDQLSLFGKMPASRILSSLKGASLDRQRSVDSALQAIVLWRGPSDPSFGAEPSQKLSCHREGSDWPLLLTLCCRAYDPPPFNIL